MVEINKAFHNAHFICRDMVSSFVKFMMTTSNSTLCSACKSLTYQMLCDGFKHPLAYTDIVTSGKTCRLCRLIVCSMGKLQKHLRCYEIEKNYEALEAELKQLPAVQRYGLHGGRILESFSVPTDVLWSRNNYQNEPKYEEQLRKGNFNGGETIQITAPETSIYYKRTMTPLRAIQPASSPRNYSLLRNWLADCRSNHENCRLPSVQSPHYDICHEVRQLPRRLIDLSYCPDKHLRPRLIETKGLSHSYVCLSHRWENSPRIKTTIENLDDFQKRIPTSSMSPTFLHAMEATHHLGFRYLWIDSICIVQDDDDDWQAESQRMGDIFESASCTIAAMDAVMGGVDYGLFIPRDGDPLSVQLTLPQDKIKTEASSTSIGCSALGSQEIILRPRIWSLLTTASRSEWYNRGWVFQERVLSRRIIFYTKNKLYWSCFTKTMDEEGGDPDFADRGLITRMNPNNAAGIWKQLVSQYVRCNLSFNKDRLAAFHGVVTKVSKFFPLGIHAGIVHDDTGDSLLWYAVTPALKSLNDFHAPSWAWASLDADVLFSLLTPNAKSHRILVEDIQFHMESKCRYNNPKGLCSNTCVSGHLLLRAPLGSLVQSQKLRDIKLEGYERDSMDNDYLLALLIGSATFRTGHPPLRFNDDETLVKLHRKLFVPDHTVLLMKSHLIIGFMIPDMIADIEEGKPIFCISLGVWQYCEVFDITTTSTSSKAGGMLMDELDIICLETVQKSPNLYRRVGRGRIICNGWLSQCKIENLAIV